jgi:hypothetical protein
MTFVFTSILPDSVDLQPTLISGPESIHFTGKEYLIVNQNDSAKDLFEIRYEYHCSPFKQAMILKDILAVGFEEYFYLFDLFTKSSTLRLKMEGYFGHLYFNEDLFYIADSAGIYCINKNASIIWQNKDLGIDGIIINEFTNGKILGSGEWDPPGGWRNFILDKQTGSLIK